MPSKKNRIRSYNKTGPHCESIIQNHHLSACPHSQNELSLKQFSEVFDCSYHLACVRVLVVIP